MATRGMDAAAALAGRARQAAGDEVRDEVRDAAGTRSPLRRYAWWQIRDYITERGAWLLLLSFGVTIIGWLNYDPALVPAYLRGAHRLRWLATEPERFREGVYVAFMGFGFLGTLLSVHGVVSQDRERGLHRFLFSKPVNIERFYAQKLAVHFAGLMSIASLALLGVAAVFGRGVPVGALGVVAAMFAAFGGVTFLLSTLSRIEGLLTTGLLIASAVVAGLSNENGWEWVRIFSIFLPPIESIGELLEYVTGRGRGGSLLRPLLAVTGYGLATFGAGIMVLRRRLVTR